MVRRGHEIANHTWSHSFFTPFMPPRALAGELARTNAVIEGATGRTPRWFRPPVGLMSPRVARGAELAGLDIACWSATARDGVARTTAAVALQRLESGLEPGAILVLHDARLAGDREPLALRVVATLLDRMDARGLRSVTLSELCAAPPR
jgi:peptidoglycan/xylan/chitin deacetylase (PgdA/CDA1 family)